MREDRYVAIDLKSFYASVECVERGLDPLDVNLVVADPDRTEKTICLAVTPALKSFGVPSRPRLFEVCAIVKGVNESRNKSAPQHSRRGKSVYASELSSNPALALDYIVAPPRMSLYMDYSARIYSIYLRYVAPEDIHVYSIDEVFIDLGGYSRKYNVSAREFVSRIIGEVFSETGITATAGIGSNLYLAKVAMDIIAKKMPAAEHGMRIAELDAMSYRKELWAHTPITDFWRVGRGYSERLARHGIHTMGDVALASIYDEELLYKLFGVNAELLIDHAWGYEPCDMRDIKEYRPSSKSVSTGQVLSCPYEYEKAKLIVTEMCELLVLDLVEKHIVTRGITLSIGYDIESLNGGAYSGEVSVDYYGRRVPKQAHGSVRLDGYTSSTKDIMKAVIELFARIVDRSLLVRRVNITASDILDEGVRVKKNGYKQLDIFSDYESILCEAEAKEREYEREKRRQRAIIDISHRFGKNAILKGLNLLDGATTVERNSQIGGHKA